VLLVNPIKLARSKVEFLVGASLKTDFPSWKESKTTHYGIPSKLVEITNPEITTGQNHDGDYAEIVVPDEFNPGSIMLFATDMDVSRSYVLRVELS
jgi:glycogen debranching enzyme